MSQNHLILPNSPESKPKFAVVGAGISGLTAAWYLERLVPDAQVDVYEGSDRVGGVIQTQCATPFLCELGADNFATLVPDAMQMVEDMGIRNEFISPKADHRFAQVVHNGSVIPIPNGFSLMQPTSLWAMLSTPVLSWSGKARAIAEYCVAKRTSQDDESVESFAVRRLGRECFERLVEPIVGGIFTARAETLSMQAAMPQFVSMEREFGGLIRGALAKRRSQSQSERSARRATGARYDQFLAPKQGMAWWLNRIAESLRQPIRLGQRVCESRQEQRWDLDAGMQIAIEQRRYGFFGNGISSRLHRIAWPTRCQSSQENAAAGLGASASHTLCFVGGRRSGGSSQRDSSRCDVFRSGRSKNGTTRLPGDQYGQRKIRWQSPERPCTASGFHGRCHSPRAPGQERR